MAKDSEDLIAMQSIKDQNTHYDIKNQERERFLQKISLKNNQIEQNKQQGAYN